MITVHPQEIEVQLATNIGWLMRVGQKVTIREMDFSFVLEDASKPTLVISELTTGLKVMDIPIRFGTLVLCKTKVETLAMFADVAKTVEKNIDKIGLERFKNMIEDEKPKWEERLGKMPEIIEYNGEGLPCQ